MNETEAMAIVDQRCDTTQLILLRKSIAHGSKLMLTARTKVPRSCWDTLMTSKAAISKRGCRVTDVAWSRGRPLAGISFSTFPGIPDDLAEDAKGYFWFMGLCIGIRSGGAGLLH